MSTSRGLTTPKKPQVDEQASNSPTEQTTPPQLQSHFPCKSELLLHHSCHMDAPLADDSLEWRSLRDIMPKYLYTQARCVIGSISAGKSTPQKISRIRGKAPPSPPRRGAIGKF